MGKRAAHYVAARNKWRAIVEALWAPTDAPAPPERVPYAIIFVWDDQTKALVPWTGKAKEPSAVN